MELAGQVVVVTGAARGIGQALAYGLAALAQALPRPILTLRERKEQRQRWLSAARGRSPMELTSQILTPAETWHLRSKGTSVPAVSW